MLSWQLYC